MEDESTRDIVIAKIISGVSLFVVSTICGVIPFKLAKVFKWTEPLDSNDPNSKKTNRTVGLLLCFGGGVLLATTFLHLLPEINETIAYLEEEKILPEMNLSLGELLMMIGFFLIYLIEELVHSYLHRHQKKLKQQSDVFIRGISARNSVVSRTFSEHLNSKSDLVADELPKKEAHDHHEHGHGHGHSHLPVVGEEDTLVAGLRGLLIVLALSIHELFEGFAVGLERNASGVYFMFAAVAAHKFVIAFCIGVELMVQKTKMWLAFVYVVIYSIVSALGILVGGILTSGANRDDLEVPNIILQGLATGTLLFVIFFEVLSKDRAGFKSYFAIAGGFVVMFGLQYIAGLTENQGAQAGKSFHRH